MSEGFPEAEYAARTARVQDGLARLGAAALLLTTEADIRYFTGFLTRFWESPSRSWFLVVPASGKPVAVIPSIGEALMASTWIEDIRTWPAPRPADDGVSLLREALQGMGGPIALPMGYETHLRMPLADFERLRTGLETGLEIVADEGLMASLRAIKSPAEVTRIADTCAVAGRAFDRMGDIARAGVARSEVFRAFQRLLLEEGADWVPYLAGGVGPMGYGDVISPATDAPLQAGDVLMLDTGAIRAGYFCDYNRNFAIAHAGAEARAGHRQIIEATAAGFEAARPGAMARDLWQAMANIVGRGDGAGRMGHGLGMQLTEGLSLTAEDETVLQPGMVITLEPYAETAEGCLMVHEENIVITDKGAEALTRLSGTELPVLS